MEKANELWELPTNADVQWRTNGFVWWLVCDGKQFTPPRWLCRLKDEAERDGRNDVRREIKAALKLENK